MHLNWLNAYADTHVSVVPDCLSSRWFTADATSLVHVDAYTNQLQHGDPNLKNWNTYRL